MRKTGNKTPNTKTEQIQTSSEKNAKKLVQARLPFKLIGSGVLVPTASDTDVGNNEALGAVQSETVGKQDARKRKLSYDDAEEGVEGSAEQRSAESKENLSIVTSKKKRTSTSEDVIVLDDDTEDEDDKVDETVKVNKNVVKRKSLVATSKASPKTPLQGSKKRKGAGTPNSARHASSAGSRKQSPRGGSSSATKLQIKLPLSGKKKRRKSQRKSVNGEAGSDSTSENSSDSSDDIEIIAEELNPLKRQKVECEKEKEKSKEDLEVKETQSTEGRKADEKGSEETANEKNTKKSKVSTEDEGSAVEIDNQDEKCTDEKSETDEDESLLCPLEISETKNSKLTNQDKNSKKLKANKEESKTKSDENSNKTKSRDDEKSKKVENKASRSSINAEEKTKEKKTPSRPSRTPKAKKSLQTLDTFISKENLEKQKEKANRGKEETSKQNEAKAQNTAKSPSEVKTPITQKSKKPLEKAKPTSSSKLPRVSSADADNDDDDAEDDEDAINSSASSVVEIDSNSPKPNATTITTDHNNSKATESSLTPAHVSKLDSSLNASNSAKRKSGLTPKQQRLMEQRRLAREEKERRLQEQKEEKERKVQEEKLQKQREKEEKDLVKKREREEKEEQKRKEREEKEETKRKEREEKERKRLAEIDAKNEERRKRNEVKEEEQRKKDEERRRKEQEKEEAEQKKKKAAEAFTKFFVPKSNRLSKASEAIEQDVAKEGGVEGGVYDGENSRSESLAFRPFQIKGDMKLAPLCRKVFNDDAREQLDEFITEAISDEKNSENKELPTQKLYLDELKSGLIKPGKWRRPTVDTKSDDDDVVIIEDELEKAAETIDDESARPLERYRAKLYKFHENRRPPYFGTWRKKTNVITARRPLAQDKKYFDYEVDSDLEWEEEEPGESLDGSDEEKEKESEDEDYEVDNEWFVPHGHLSDEELQNEDEGGVGDDNTREAQKAKLKILQQEFAQEMKKKTEKIKPRLIGCIWQDSNGNQPELCPNIIWNSLNLRAMLFTSSPLVEEPPAETTNEANEPLSPTNQTSTSAGATEKLKPILLTEKMLKDLIRLVHGNRHSKVFLVKEFIAYIEQTENAIKNGDVRGPLKSVIRDKIEEFALWQVVEAKNHLKNKKKNKKRLCWLVSEDKLKKYDLESLELHNKWTYTLPPKYVEGNSNAVNESASNEKEELEDGKIQNESNNKSCQPKKSSKKDADVITKFTKVLTTEEKAKQLERNIAAPSKIDTTASSQAASTTPSSETKEKSTSSPLTTTNKQQTAPTVKKRVPLLMSVARGQQISTPAKNALISQFLKNNKDAAAASKRAATDTTPTHMDVDEVVILD